ncbi:DivIVA domain-containing protein [Streptomyces sp. NPDC048416]|uniref:DivIVA domain-containing protein n=1 Tax=Streptomyces sp. NPDC048416 TaxID=3365546 RepID=UPI003721EF2B
MFWFLLIAMVVVVTAVTLAVVGGGDDAGVLPEAEPEHLVDPLPEHRPVARADVEALRIPVALRGYRMADVDDVLSRLGAELAERDERIAELQSAAAGQGRQGPAAARQGATQGTMPGTSQGTTQGHPEAEPSDEEPQR